MMLIRPVNTHDLDALYHLAKKSGVGLTLKADKKYLKERIAKSEKSFASTETKPTIQYYLFVLEDTANKKIVGTSAIDANVGYTVPFYSYRVSKIQRYSAALDIRKDYEELHLVNDNHGKSEICTLFLNSDYRKKYNGLLLSRSRFLFMAQFPERFAERVIAEMRGVSNEKGQSPFWDSLGRHFFAMEFESADILTARTHKQLIMDLMPRNPIHVSLLSKKAQNVIGKTHRSTRPAYKILQREGFKYKQYIDIFDAGPTIEVQLVNIRTIQKSRLLQLKAFSDDLPSKPYIISNVCLDFRACVDQVHIENNQLMLRQETAENLGLKIGDHCRLVLL